MLFVDFAESYYTSYIVVKRIIDPVTIQNERKLREAPKI